MSASPDPYAVLGLPRDADQSQIHAAYRAAVRRTHPDAGGSAAEFEAVQSAYESLRHATARGVGDAPPPRPAPGRPADTAPAEDPAEAGRAMEDLLADSRRIEDEARRLAGLPPRYDGPPAADAQPEDSISAILRDASEQLREAASAGARELRRQARRRL